MASKCIYIVTHLVIGKTTSKKALSCTRLQEGENPKLGRNSTCLNLFASARPTYMNVGPKLGLEANQIFLFKFLNFSTEN